MIIPHVLLIFGVKAAVESEGYQFSSERPVTYYVTLVRPFAYTLQAPYPPPLFTDAQSTMPKTLRREEARWNKEA